MRFGIEYWNGMRPNRRIDIEDSCSRLQLVWRLGIVVFDILKNGEYVSFIIESAKPGLRKSGHTTSTLKC